MNTVPELTSLLRDNSSLAIICHDNPDPDCLASALALERIAEACGIESISIVYGGEISHQQNRAFVNLLDISLTPLSDVTLSSFDVLAFVDHSRASASAEISNSIAPDVIVDHHPGDPDDATFLDVRPEYGATVTIFFEYIRELEIELTSRLASAMLFAIHRERLDYIRGPTQRDYEAALELFPYADVELLEQLYGSAFSPATLDAIGRAIVTRHRRRSSLVASVGKTSETDALPQAADYLLNLAGVDTVLVYGIVDRAVRLSARTNDPRLHIGKILEQEFGEFGTVGGHYNMAGGRIELGIFGDDTNDDESLLEFLDSRITERFFDALDLDD